MGKQILINAAPWEVRVAVLEDTTLVELHVERRRERGIAGNIYKGKVLRVLPGMQAAFLEIGLEKAAFLHVSDLLAPPGLPDADDGDPDPEPGSLQDDLAPTPEEATAELPPIAVDGGPGHAGGPAAEREPEADVSEHASPGEPLDAADATDAVDGGEDETVARSSRRRASAPPPRIEERLQRGQELLVQISKEPMGSKGARVTANISLPGRHLVYMPGTRHIGVSRRIEDPAERDRLREIVEAERPGEGGLIVRTACEGATRQEIHDDVRFLTKLWAKIEDTAASAAAPALIHQDLDVALRTVRDLFTAEIERLVVDAREDFSRVLEFVEAVMPRLAGRVHHYHGVTPLFEQHGVETKIARALERRVWLKSGGYLIFDQTESLTTVDVNTGRYVGKTDQEETVLRTNLEAAKAVVQQLRLRNIGGIIVIDFIDMEQVANRTRVFDALQEALKGDKARSNVLRISELGLVQMTRKRTRESLGQLLTTPCASCDGLGRVRSAEMLAYEGLRKLQRETPAHPHAARFVLRLPPDVANFLTAGPTTALVAAERLVGRPIGVEADPTMARGEVAIRAEPAAG